MTRAVPLAALLAVALAALLPACSPRRSAPPASTALSPETTRGRVAFQVHCDRCHPGGEAGLGPGLNNRRLPGFLVRLQVRRGLGAMPAFPTDVLTDDSLDDVVSWLKHVRSLPSREGR